MSLRGWPMSWTLPEMYPSRRANGRASWSSCTRWAPARPTVRTGVEVAKRAGLPAAAVKRAQAILAKLESDGSPAAATRRSATLFRYACGSAAQALRAEERLKAINPDELTPARGAGRALCAQRSAGRQ